MMELGDCDVVVVLEGGCARERGLAVGRSEKGLGGVVATGNSTKLRKRIVVTANAPPSSTPITLPQMEDRKDIKPAR